ncbi:MAG: molybdopterin-synthase adenylyltransferase MoeB [Methylotenera sp.]|uniref:HesA/MoeB/ThiF family protein n=1 Tax=Methylotenera sp. TaxID=2051956 RepID=UPI0027281090|nr:molybdopterin-synthase adenylyltransferase MoeB [Methylotenera sp.]MDO9393091.1 molybdopterin-synthase adenylyltransferase MoeB [Methylotenera sp.]MDP1523040.1 molybdopterin-synthase adenylyltransferase MoeB [Methylotenera sp.]MDZ4211115.1 molybdopterin-synthase adenylyltransferase MoeB [Methylotenera sp.]
MNDNQLLRYSRHILLPQISYEGQEKLVNSHALIVGAGGLGSPVALYLAASGVGALTICDFDVVDLTNLQRQIIHTTQSVGINKAVSAQQTIYEINPEVAVKTIQQKSTEDEFAALVAEADVVIDCSDNFATRYTLNRLCVKLKKPLVSGAAIGFEGQITVYDMRSTTSPCYHCLFPDASETTGEDNEMRCATNGVFAPLVGMIGTTQAAEALKILMSIGDSLQGRLLLLDALSMEWRAIKLGKDPACSVCGTANL